MNSVGISGGDDVALGGGDLALPYNVLFVCSKSS